MSRNFCQACNMIRNGVKTRIALEHSCGLERGAIPKDIRNDIDQMQQDKIDDKIAKEYIDDLNKQKYGHA